MKRRIGPLLGAGTLLGIGLGGFVDGILFHQILQWHNMLSTWVAPNDLLSMKYNMIWDGLFHAATWFLTALGVFFLFRAGRSPDVALDGKTFSGSLALGWGLFNLVEGIIDHHILAVHHVHPGAHQLAWDLGFLLSGLILMTVGIAVIRAGHDASRGPATAPVAGTLPPLRRPVL
jgi:uncharacterized membrane protein